MKQLEVANVKADLYAYFRNKTQLISPEFSKVVAEATAFTTSVVRNGFEAAFMDLPVQSNVQPDRPFIEIAEALTDHQIRFLRQADREIARKSLLEVYTHIAGPRYVFEPTKKTRFVQSLRRSEPKKFAALLLSLHLYNMVCARIQDNLRSRIANVQSFQLYLSNVERICRDVVNDAVKIPTPELDEAWAKTAIRHAETQIQHQPVHSPKSPDLSVPTGRRK